MPRLLLLIVLVVPPWLAVRFGAPNWGIALAAAPFFLLAMTMGDGDQQMFGDASESIGAGLLLLMGLLGVVVGVVAWSLRGTSSLLAVLWWAGPIGLLMVGVAVVRWMRR